MTFLIISRIETLIEVWLKIMNRKQHGFTKIYFGQEYIPCMCWTNKWKFKWVTINFGGYGLPKDCQKIACTIKKREHFDKINFIIIFSPGFLLLVWQNPLRSHIHVLVVASLAYVWDQIC